MRIPLRRNNTPYSLKLESSMRSELAHRHRRVETEVNDAEQQPDDKLAAQLAPHILITPLTYFICHKAPLVAKDYHRPVYSVKRN